MKIFIKITLVLIALLIQISCIDSVSKQIGSCYILEKGDIKYLQRTETGDLDTLKLDGASVAFFEIVLDEIPGDECVNGNIWAKDKLNVWFKNRKIKGADPATFEVMENGYAKDKQYAFYYDTLLSGSDVLSFRVLSYFFSKDKDMIWYQGKEVFGVDDIFGFDIIDGYFSKDQNNIYFNNDTVLMKIPNSDVKTFTCFENQKNFERNSLKYYIDKNNVYFIDTEKSIDENDFLFVFEAFTSSFKVLPYKYYSKDNFNIYYKNEIIVNADMYSFSSPGNDYAKDKNTIYFKHKKLNGVDYKTFMIFDDDKGFDARDSKSYFLKGKKVRENSLP